jgi:hypothetical protein
MPRLIARLRTTGTTRKRHSNCRSRTIRAICPRRKWTGARTRSIDLMEGETKSGRTRRRASCCCLSCCCSCSRPHRRHPAATPLDQPSNTEFPFRPSHRSAAKPLQPAPAIAQKISDPKPPAKLAARRATARSRNPSGPPGWRCHRLVVGRTPKWKESGGQSLQEHRFIVGPCAGVTTPTPIDRNASVHRTRASRTAQLHGRLSKEAPNVARRNESCGLLVCIERGRPIREGRSDT